MENGLQAVALKFFIAMVLGALIGTQRERKWKDSGEFIGGFRTYVLISLFGAIAGFMSTLGYGITPFLVMFSIFSGLVIAMYVYASFTMGHVRVTTQVTALLAFLIGGLSFFTDYTIPVILAIMVTIILAYKQAIHSMVYKITQEEFLDALKFAIIAFIILPLLPNIAVDPWGIFNPFEVWRFVVLVSAISFIGYVLSNIVTTEKGILLTALIGGIASSTATTLHLSAESKKSKGGPIYPFVSGILIASCMMCMRLWLLILILAQELAWEVLPILSSMLVVGGLMLLFMQLLMKNKKEGVQTTKMRFESSFKILPAVKFGIAFLVIQVIEVIAKTHFGDSGIYIFSALAGLADVDPPTYIIAGEFADHAAYTAKVAAQGITLAIVANTFSKSLLPFFFADRKVAWYSLLAFIPMMLVGVLFAFFGLQLF